MDMKRIISLILSLTMIFVTLIPLSAAEETGAEAPVEEIIEIVDDSSSDVIEETVSEEGSSEEIADENDETAADETAADETAADETVTDETAVDETVTDETAADETAADETVEDETVTDETVTDETAEDETVEEEENSEELTSFVAGLSTYNAYTKIYNDELLESEYVELSKKSVLYVYEEIVVDEVYAVYYVLDSVIETGYVSSEGDKLSEEEIDAYLLEVESEETVVIPGREYVLVAVEIVSEENVEDEYVEDNKAATAITKQPEDAAGAVGTNVVFSVEATGEGLTYQWQHWAGETAKNWINTSSTGSDTANMTIAVKAYRDGYKYRCMITDANGNVVYSSEALLTVSEPEVTIEITKQPENAAGAVGTNVVFSVGATGEGLTYQWQHWAGETAKNWINTSSTGSDTANMTIAVKAYRDGYKYRCQITDANGNTAYSGEALLTVGEPEVTIEITKQPENVTAVVGTDVVFSVEATGEGLTYQWQHWAGETAKNWIDTSSTGSDTATMTIAVKAYRDGYKYRCQITDANGNIGYSDEAILTVGVAPVITAQPVDAEAIVGNTVQFAVTATCSIEMTYQWEMKAADSEEWTAIAGAVDSTLDVVVAEELNNYAYRCVVTSADGMAVTSEAAVLTAVNGFTVDNVKYVFVIKEDTITLKVTKYEGTAAVVTIPESVEGYTVTEIGDSAFEGNTTLTSIDLPDCIEVIGVRAFANCTSLSEMK